MEQTTLFDLSTLPQKQEAPKPAPDPTRYYVYGEKDGRQYVYWKGHDNGNDEWYWLDEEPRRVPHLFKTYKGALRTAQRVARGAKVGTWKGRKS